MKLCLLLVLLCLPALSLAVDCQAGATKDSGCSDCVDTTPTSDCNWCKNGFYKTGPKACTACPANTGRSQPGSAITVTETDSVCWKCSPQLKCKSCNYTPFKCSECATGSYTESGVLFGAMRITGCSTDCKTFSTATEPYLVPNVETPPLTYCSNCPYDCAKCSYTTTLKGYAGETTINKQRTVCEVCNPGFYLLPNKDTTIIPSCENCGANCKKCKDRTECNECFPGWALDGSDKAACTKAVAVSAFLLQGAFLSIIALIIGW